MLVAAGRSDARYSRRPGADKRFRPELRAVTGFSGHETVICGSAFFAAVLGQLQVNFSLPRHRIFSVFLSGAPVVCHARLSHPADNSEDPLLIQVGVRFGGWRNLH